jgi:two-component system nitrogen regulation sensor histidine kinase NtrY
MAFRRFRFRAAVRITLLTVSLGLAVYVVLVLKTEALAVVLIVLSVGQVLSLVRFVEHSNRDLTRFLRSVGYEDYSQSFRDEGLGPSFAALRTAMAEVMETLRRTRAEKEEQAQYLQTVVQHIGVGLLVFQPDGTVELINNAAKHLFRVPWLKSVADLGLRSENLVETLLRLGPKEQGFVKVEDEKESLFLALYATEFRIRDRNLKLVSIQNIHRELEEREMEAWQKLIRVITHEIMNSVTPISSLASTINGLVDEGSPAAADGVAEEAEFRKDIRLAAQTIEKRSQGLLHFVDAFRSLTLVPKPKPQFFGLRETLDRVGRLMTPDMVGKDIGFSVEVEPETLELNADPELIEQVLINLLLNALQAVEGRPEAAIRMKAFLNERGRIIVQVIDNGPGIPAENIEKIFVPFFSTKKSGSGIGLSLSRQIMRLHRGTIHAHSEPGGQTVFTLSF